MAKSKSKGANDKNKGGKDPLAGMTREQLEEKLRAWEESELAESLMDVDDDDIRKALQALGRAVIGRGRG